MNKKIVLGMDSWFPQIDGVVLTVKNYYEQLTNTGNECSLIVPSYGKKVNLQADKDSKINALRCKKFPIRLGGFYCALPKTDADLHRSLEEIKPDLLHSHSPFNLGDYFAEYGAKHDIPSVYTFHTKFREEFMRITKSKAITNMLTKRIVRTINKQGHVWTVCNGMIDVLRQYGYNGDVTVIRNGTDLTVPSNADELVQNINTKYNLTDCDNVMLFVGRIVTVKNLQLMLNAIKIAKQKSSVPLKLVVVGDGADMELHKKMVADLEITDNVLFVGEIADREQLKGFYLRADLFVFPSTFDAFSLCPIEAATFSLPTLLIKDSSTGETVKDNFSGFCEIEDATAWADRIIEIFTNKNELDAIGANARKYVYRSWEDVVREVEQHYDAILSGKE
ncbi:MAG: glycosyltransferase [Clostridia bacterium]|nr:glycosyltransferase [Clostridia bacterium]